MESLHLPQDLYWDVKMEPNSPPSEFVSAINAEDSWIFEDNFAKNVLSPPSKTEIDFSNASSPLNEGELLYEFEFDLKPEQWIDDGKQNAQQYMDYSETLILPQSCPTQAIKVQNPLEIIMELEKIYDISELTQLTPPQTPPQESAEVKEIYDIITQQNPCPLETTFNDNNGSNHNNSNDVIDIPAMSPSNSDYSSDAANSPMPSDIAREMQIVDEILRTRAKELPDWTEYDDDDDDDGESLHSLSSVLSSSSSSQLSISSASPPSNDDEWIPSANSSSASAGSSIIGKMPLEKSQKKRTRPYGRPVEDKKVRKKEQNKNAATRYRQKKKQEMEEVLGEERELVKRNEELSKQVNDIEREVKYLKQLIKEFHKSKKAVK